MTNQEMLQIAMKQSAEDIGCKADDFLLSDNVTVPFHLDVNARKYLKEPIACNLVCRGGYSGLTIFSSKIVCGECGSWYGSKVWHSTDQYRRVIWQCNAKFKTKKHCRTPHLTEDEVKAAFLRMMNGLITDRDMILEGMREDQAMLTGTEDLERQQKQLAEQMNVDADAVQELIAQNARVAQDQAEYTVRYEALSTRFNETKEKYDTVTAQIAQLGIRRRELGRFIRQVEELPETITKFDEALWGSMVDHLTVHAKDNIVFTLTGGMEVRA